MKKSTFFIVLTGLIFFVGTCFAQNENMLFTSSDQSKEAFSNNIFSCYESVERKDGYKIFAGEDTISFPYYTTVKMEVVGGVFWVIQKPWTVFIVEKGKITRRFDCRNTISGFYQLSSTNQTQSLAYNIDGRDGKDGRDGVNGKDGRDGRDGQVPPITVLLVDDNGFPWATLIVATLTAVVGVLAYLVVDRYYDQQKKDSPTGGPPITNALPPAKLIFGGKIIF